MYPSIYSVGLDTIVYLLRLSPARLRFPAKRVSEIPYFCSFELIRFCFLRHQSPDFVSSVTRNKYETRSPSAGMEKVVCSSLLLLAFALSY